MQDILTIIVGLVFLATIITLIWASTDPKENKA